MLALYLDLAPYGGNIEGIRAASLAYFGKEPRRLSLGEAALLVALPQSPEARRPDRSVEAARAARDRVLDRFAAPGTVPADEIALAKAEPVPAARRPMPMLAPHAADERSRTLRRGSESGSPSMPACRRIWRSWRASTSGRWRRRSGRISRSRFWPSTMRPAKCWRGSARRIISTTRRAGQVDMTQALRSPGSTLKPFIYGLGFEDGFIHPETLIEDRPVRYGAYAPENFDFTFQGTVTVRKALQLSLNVPAVAVLDQVGAEPPDGAAAQAGAALVLPKGEAPGLAMGLGGVGIRLSDLVMLYAGLARLGTALPLRRAIVAAATGSSAHDARRLMEPVAAWYVGNVLFGTPPPENGAAGRIAFKTGTSYGYRDAWSVGFDGKHTIGVWVGRPDGAPVPGLVGRTAAAPILFDAFARSGAAGAAAARARGRCLTTNAKLPPPLRRFAPGDRRRRAPRSRAAHPVSARRRAARTARDRRRSPIRWR